jgi:hypothetical protein
MIIGIKTEPQKLLVGQPAALLLPSLGTSELARKLTQEGDQSSWNRRKTNLMDWLLSLATELETSREKMLDSVTKMVIGLEQTFTELSAAARFEAASELARFRGRLEKEMAFEVGALRSDIESVARAKRDELTQTVEEMCAAASDELQLLKKSVLTELNQNLSECIESTRSSIDLSSRTAKKLVENKVTGMVQQSESIINETLEELNRVLKVKVADLSNSLERRAQMTCQKLETAADSQLQSEFKERIENVKQDLDKTFSARTAEFSEQAGSVVQGFSHDLRENIEKKAEEARGEFDVVVKEAARELQNKLSTMRDEVVLPQFTNARGVLNDLKKLNANHKEIQSVLHEAALKTERLEASVKAGSENISYLNERIRNQVAAAQQSVRGIESFTTGIEKTIVDLEQRAQAAFDKARLIIEQEIPETVRRAAVEGRSQAILESKSETAKEIHLVLGGLYAELRILEKEMREKIEAVKGMIEDQKKSLVATVQGSGNESLSQWVMSKLSPS